MVARLRDRQISGIRCELPEGFERMVVALVEIPSELLVELDHGDFDSLRQLAHDRMHRFRLGVLDVLALELFSCDAALGQINVA